VLYDAYGRVLYEGGLSREDIRDAIQAAALADDWRLADEIATRYGWDDICRKCAIEPATTGITVERIQVQDSTVVSEAAVCGACEEQLRPKFSEMRSYMHGLIHRTVV